jgi:short-subunit dehydrogenase
MAVITGATSGIGRAFAERLAREGYDLLVTGRRATVLRGLAAALAKETGARVTTVIAELSDARDVAGLVRRVEKLERIDVLVSNAGYGSGLAFRQTPVDDHLRMVAVHVNAALRLAHAVLKGMVARREGTIVIVASLAAFLPLPGSAVYCATKAFLNSLAESIAMEVSGLGIKVQSLCPGLVRTDFHGRTKRWANRSSESRDRGFIRWMSAEQVVDRSFKDLARGRVLCVPGFWNRVGFIALKLIPQRLYSRIVGRYR